MKKNYYLLFLLLGMLIYGNILQAQNIPNDEKRRMNLSLLETIEKLETLSTMSDSGQANAYVDLFRDPETMVFNDLIGVSDAEKLPLNEYVSRLKNMDGVVVRFSNVERSRPYIDAGSVCVRISFDKTISYVDQRGIHYSSNDIYGHPYKITVVFSYDDFDGSCRIESYDGSLGEVRALPADHLVLKKKRWHEGLRFRNEDISPRKGFYGVEECDMIRFDKSGYAILPSAVVDEDWYHMQDIPSAWDPDKSLYAEKGTDGFVDLYMDSNHMRIKAYNSAAPAGVFLVKGDMDRKITVGNETGVEFRYMFDLGKRFNLGAMLSAGISYSYIDVSQNDFGYSYYLTSSIKRNYAFEIFGQKFHTADVAVSAGIAAEYAFAKRWSLDYALGCKAYYNIYAGYSDVYCVYDVSQSGQETDHIKGHFKKETFVNAVDFKSGIESLPLSLFAKLGFNFSLSSSSLLTFGLGYEHGLGDYYKSEQIPFNSYEYPVMYSSKFGYDEVHHSLVDSFNLVKRALWVDLGYVFRF